MDAAYIFKFLSDLSRHNDREWFATQTERYQKVKQEFQEFVADVFHSMADVRAAYGEVDPAKCVYRIYRDIRFSKNKTPYKTNVSALVAEGGRHADVPCGYFQIGPDGKSFVACGLYEPTTAELHLVRQRIAADPAPLRAILKGMKRHFPDGFTGERSVRLRGFTPDHPAYDLLIFKSYVATRAFTDEEVLAKKFPAQLKASLKAMLPLLDWLQEARQDPDGGPRGLPMAGERRSLKSERAKR